MSEAADTGDRKTIAVIGADDHNLALIRAIPEAKDWDLVRVLEWEEVQPDNGRIDFDALYRRARQRIDRLDAPPDAVTNYLDFPTTCIEALLRRDYGLPGATPEAVSCMENKYWMREIEAEVAPDAAAATAALNPFDPEETRRRMPPYPFWLKPVAAHSSVLGFMIEDAEDLDRALHECRLKLHFFGDPFNAFLARLREPQGAEAVGGNHAVAEELVSASRQFTLEGYVRNGETTIYGVVDSLRTGQHKSSFARYQYPARVPPEVTQRARDYSIRMLEAFGYDGSPFNAEFFWDPETDALRLLEMNPRISKSHSPLFRMVDGVSHHKVAIDLALGREPRMPSGEGRDEIAAKFMWRSLEADGIVKRVPERDEIAELKRLMPDLDLEILVDKEERLSDMFYQDSYTYELAVIFLGAHAEEVLEDSFRMCISSLPIHLKPLPDE